MSRVLKTKLVGMTTHKSGHPLAPMDYVYEVEDTPPQRKRIPLGAKLWGVYIILATLYGLIQGGINTFS